MKPNHHSNVFGLLNKIFSVKQARNNNSTVHIRLLALFIIGMPFLFNLHANQPIFIQKGYAKVYDNSYNGNILASNQPYKPDKLTAAHLTLPFDTKVKVINLENNKTVTVIINDRGPFHHKKIIQLSRAAAHKLNICAAKSSKVQIIPIKDEISHVRTVPSKTKQYQRKSNTHSQHTFGIQVASYKNVNNLRNCINNLNQSYENILIEENALHEDTVYRIIIGIFHDKSHASNLKSQLKMAFPDCFIKPIQSFD